MPSSVGLGVLMEKNNTVRQAGGFIIQLMPFTPDEVVDELEKKLGRVRSVTSMLDAGMDPEAILYQLLGDLDMKIEERHPVSYRCDCSRERIERALISIGRKDLQEMADAGEPIEVCCHFCDRRDMFTKEDLFALLSRSMERPAAE